MMEEQKQTLCCQCDMCLASMRIKINTSKRNNVVALEIIKKREKKTWQVQEEKNLSGVYYLNKLRKRDKL